MQKLKGYKTIIFNIVMSIGTLVTLWTGYDASQDTETIIESLKTSMTVATTIWGIGNVWLRAVTNSPIFKAKDEKR